MIEVVVVPNALTPLETEVHDVPALIPWLIERFGRWPETGRLYHRMGECEYDVTPDIPEDCATLARLQGTFVVRIFPAGLDPITGIGNLIYLAVKLWDWIVPDVPTIKTPQQRALQQGGSPNNALGRRENQPRPEQRIPYIVGAVRSVPDLLGVPYTTYVDHVEVETAYFCVGVGDHIVQSVRDGDTLVSQIPGASAEIYGPGDAPTGGFGSHDPHTTIGDPIEDDVYNVYAVEAVNGQEMRGFSDLTFYGSAFPQNSETAVVMRFFDNGDGTGVISIPYSTSTEEVTDRLAVGDELHVYWPTEFVPPGGVGPVPDLSTPTTSDPGEPVEIEGLTVLAIDDTDDDIQLVHVTVQIPTAQQAEWALLETYFDDLQDPGELFDYVGATFPHAAVSNMRELYVGPFFVDFEHSAGGLDTFEIVCNFVAPRGLFQDDGVTVRPLYIEMGVYVTPADSSGNPIGASQFLQATLEGSAVARGSRALTLRVPVTGFTSTRCLVRAQRITNSPRKQRQTDEVEEDVFGADLDEDPPFLTVFSGSVVDEIRWTHCYSMTKPPNISFGNVTTIHTRTVATSGALRVKSRELNCFASRKIQTWDGSALGGAQVANSAAENIIFTVMKDQYIGALDDANIDFEGIVAACEAVRASVGSGEALPTSFNYTFDDVDLSFEETLQAICQATFLVPFRRGTLLSVRPEIATDDSVLVLNHRNILRDTVRFTTTYGPPTENDSVEVSYVDESDNTQAKVTLPLSGTLLRTRQVKVIGLTDRQQAFWHAYRAFQKMSYQRVSATLEATQEAEAVGSRERVLIADGTRVNSQEGDILAIDGSVLTTSQPVELEDGRAYTLCLQQPDGTVGEWPVVDAPSTREIEVDGTPDVITDPGLGVRTLYILTPDDAPSPGAFLVSSVRASTPLTHAIEAVNYSHMYYIADGLHMWIDFSVGLDDLSPFQRLLDATGGSVSGDVWTGEFGDFFEDLNPAEDLNTGSYTKLLWVNATSAPTLSHLISTDDPDAELFEITSGDILLAGHDGSSPVTFDYGDYVGEMHCVAATYDEAEERLCIFVDGALVAEGDVAPAPPGEPLRYLENFEGTCRLLMKWGRCLSPREVSEITLRTRPS